MIRTEGLTKKFKVHQKEPGLLGSVRALYRRKWIEKTAIQDISIQINPGEIVGFVGANGAGKTTLVKTLAGIIHPTSGKAEVLGFRPWNREDRFRRQIALIMGQKAQLWWDLPAADCFLLLKEIYQIPEKAFRHTLDFLSQTLQVEDQLKIQIRRLSLGERMKMELIAALLHKPKVVFLDEPTIGLDLTAQKSIRKFLLDYRQENQPAMILTSHYMEDIENLCERIVILLKGKVIYDGGLNDVINRYATHKVISVRLHRSPDSNSPGSNSIDTSKLIPADLGQIVSESEDELRIKIKRTCVAEAASEILQKFPVADLTIEEEEIGDIIESIIRKGLTRS